jgi:outer membrane receptor protein involved in Fe transport
MRLTQILRGTTSLAVLSAFAAGATTVAHAAAPASAPSTVQEIVVTAQKREQNLQDVPEVVTPLPAALLQNAGVRDIKDMQILTPGLTVTSTSNETITSARIRGVGTVGDNPGLESSVGVVIDGVYRPRNGVSFGDMGDVSRIEVLKGPQGTLFGKNTSAGVINILTEKPNMTAFEAKGEVDVGNYNYIRGSAYVSGPIANNLAASLFFADGKRDGFYKVGTTSGPRTDTDDQDQNYWTARGQMMWEPDDKTSLRLIADYTHRDEHCCVAVQTLDGPTAGIVDALALGGKGVVAPADPFGRFTYANRSTEQRVEDYGVSAELNHSFDIGTLTSITALRHWHTDGAQDVDYSGADIVYRPDDGGTYGTFDTFSEEIRLAGKTDRLDWLVGGFYADERLKSGQDFSFGGVYNPYISLLITGGATPFIISCLTGTYTGPPGTGTANCDGPSFPVGKVTQDNYSQTDTTWALFTNEDFHITSKLDVTVGLRYTSDDKKLTSSYANLQGNGAGAVCGGAAGNLFAGNWASHDPALGGAAYPSSAWPIAFAVLCLPWSNPLFNGFVSHQTSSETDLSGTVKLAYHWTPDLMTYASYARGFKAGGFNLDRVQSNTGLASGSFGLVPVANTSFAPETVDSMELGVKSTLAGGRLLLDATLFDQEYHHFQLNQFNGLVFVVDSIPEVTSRGVDADAIWFSGIEGLTMRGGVTYADTRYNHFAPTDLVSISNYPSLSLLPGNQISFAPLWSVSGAVSYDHAIADSLRFLWNIDAKYLSSYNTGSDLDPNKLQPAYTLVNGRIGIGSADHRWTVELWGMNLLDTHYRQVVFDAPLQGSAFQQVPTASGPYKGTFFNPALDTQTYDAFLGQPRTFGVTLRVKY